MRRNVIALLGLYVDFIFVGTIVALGSFFASRTFGHFAGTGMAWYAEIGVGVALTGLARALGLSVGKPLLAWAADQAEREAGLRLWPNLVLGTLLVLDGLKMMVRWSQLDATTPLFGLVETGPLKIVLLVATGAATVAAGSMLLAFAPRARLAAVAVLALLTASFATSWPVMDRAIALVVKARREAQGVPVREGEIEAMQAMAAAMLAVTLLPPWLSRERGA